MVYAFLRDRYATPRHPLTPWAATPRTQSLFHPFFDVGGKTTVRVAKRKRSGRGAEEGEGKGWRRCHCTALGEGHYSEQGEPVTSAPTPGIDPTPSAALPLPPPPVCRVWHGVQCTVRFSTFIILARCVHAPTEGTRYCYLFGAFNVASLCPQIFSHWPCFRSVNLGFFNLFGAALVRRVVSFGGNREHLNRIYTLSLWMTVAIDPSKNIVFIRVSFKVEPISALDGSSTMIVLREKVWIRLYFNRSQSNDNQFNREIGQAVTGYLWRSVQNDRIGWRK